MRSNLLKHPNILNSLVAKVLFTLLVVLLSASLIAQTSHAAQMSSQFVRFISNANTSNKKDVRVFASYLTSGEFGMNESVDSTFGPCSQPVYAGSSFMYQGKSIDGSDYYGKFKAWVSNGASSDGDGFTFSSDSKASKVAQLMSNVKSAASADPSMKMENGQSAGVFNTGMCAYIVKYLTETMRLDLGEVDEAPQDTEKQSIIAGVTANCIASFNAMGGGNSYSATDFASILEGLSDGDFDSKVKANADTATEGDGPGCSLITEALKTEIEAFIQAKRDAACEVDPESSECKDGAGEDKSSCVIDGIGWIVCPVLNFTAGIVDGAYGFISSLLTVQPLLTTGESTGIFNAWAVMRSVANVAFVIAFLIIIFSQLTSLGISNYGVKKMLPRLVVAALLVNVSYWICAIGVDLSNIIGSSARGLFDAVGGEIPNLADNPTISSLDTGAGWLGLTGAMLAGTIAIGVTLYVGLSALIPALLAALLAIVTVFLVLTLRQALIILLIVISPLAFVAYLLPNTEGLFTKWRKLLTTLLLMYPIIAAIFGASALASTIVMNSASGPYTFVIQIMGALIAILPLAITPLVMKTAGGLLNRFGGIVNNPNKGPYDRLQKRAGAFRNDQEGKRRIRALSGGRVFGAGRFRREARRKAISKGIEGEAARSEAGYVSDQAQKVDAFRNQLAGGSRFNPAGETANNRALANAINIEAKLEVDEVNAAKAVIENANLDGNDRQTLAKTGTVTKDGKTYSSPIMQKAAIQEQLRTGSMQQIHEIVGESGSSLKEFAQTIAQGVASNGIASKDPALGGKTIDLISQGKVVSDDPTVVPAAGQKRISEIRVDAAYEGKYTAEAVAGMHDDARQEAYDAVSGSTAPKAPGARANLKSAAKKIRKTKQLSARISGNTRAERQVSDMEAL